MQDFTSAMRKLSSLFGPLVHNTKENRELLREIGQAQKNAAHRDIWAKVSLIISDHGHFGIPEFITDATSAQFEAIAQASIIRIEAKLTQRRNARNAGIEKARASQPGLALD